VSIIKSVSNLISYLHNFFWIFSHFIAIYFELFSSRSKFNSEIADMRGPPVSRRFPHRACLSARRRRVAATLACRAAPLACLKGAVGTARRRPDNRSDRASPLTRPRRCLTSRAPILTAPSSVSEADHRCPSEPPSLSGRLRRRELFHGERSSSPLLPLFLLWNVEPSSFSLHPDAGPPPAIGALASSENAAANLSPPSTRSFGELSPPPPCPAGSLSTVDARAPSFAPPPLL
jgi:hypothetical protein